MRTGLNFRTVLLGGIAAIALAASANATPIVTGTVNITGTVTSSCSVALPAIDGGLWGTIGLGELDGPGGTLNPALTGGGAQGNTVTVSVVCNSANPKVTLTATKLVDGASAPAGYTSSIDYTAHIDLDTTTPATFGANYPTATGVQSPAAPAAIGAPLTTTAGNVRVSVHSLAATGVLTAGSYTAAISITISPT
jgi:hypothetical protein